MSVLATLGAVSLALVFSGHESRDEELEAALRRALEGSFRSLAIQAECLTEAGFHSVALSGKGVLVWNRTRQSIVPEEAVQAQLESFRDFRFTSLEDRYGGKGDPGGDAQPPRILCRVRLDIDGIEKEVLQYEGGRQSEELRRLAERTFELARPYGESGVEARDLGEGLNKVSSGALSPEALVVTVQRRQGSEGWLLRVEGLTATLQLLPYGGAGEPGPLKLDPSELRELSRRLADLRIADLPVNLYAEHYTDVAVSVLGREKRIQARAFGRLTPTSLGEQQERFDAILAEILKLRDRVLEAGSTKPGVEVKHDLGVSVSRYRDLPPLSGGIEKRSGFVRHDRVHPFG
jgi:hypothetical protein